jgi:hypothetical protein
VAAEPKPSPETLWSAAAVPVELEPDEEADAVEEAEEGEVGAEGDAPEGGEPFDEDAEPEFSGEVGEGEELVLEEENGRVEVL